MPPKHSAVSTLSEPKRVKWRGRNPTTGQQDHFLSNDKSMHANSPFKFIVYATKNKDGWGVAWPSVIEEPKTYNNSDGALEVKAFSHVMFALHSKDYQLNDCFEIVRMTKIAASYHVLPIVSYSLNVAFFANPGLSKDIPKYACSLLESAYLLRHKLLFNDCFIHVLGPWSKPRYKSLTEPTLLEMAVAAENSMKEKINVALHQMMQFVCSISTTYGSTIELAAYRSRSESGKVMYPPFFQDLFKCFPNHAEFRMPLIGNKLKLDKSGTKAGEGIYRDYFLSFDVEFTWDDAEWA